MDQLFIKKVGSAAKAGWWTVLIAVCVLWLQWFAYLFFVGHHPVWLLNFWGGGIMWDDIQFLWLQAIIAFKIGVGFMILVVIWLTIWRKLLAKQQD